MVMPQFEHLAWSSGQLWLAALRHRTAPPSVGEYLRMRWVKSGAPLLGAFGAPGAGYALAHEDFREPLVRAFTMAVMYPCIVFNEVVSLFKEDAAGHGRTNLVTVLAREHRLSLPEALLAAWELYERITCLMLRLQQRLRADPRPAVARYAAQLPQWLPATAHFTATSARYLQPPTAPAGPTRTAPAPVLTVTDTPTVWDPDDLAPPPYPDIAWWWNHLQP
jgi:hypothetical protein